MPASVWRVAGSYFEACNCEAICPCRRQGGLKLTSGSSYGVRPAKIELEHAPRRWFMRANDYVTVRATAVVPSALAVSCGIPGHDHPGEEVLTDIMKVDDRPLRWEVSARCGFATDFDYASDPA